MKNSTDFIVVVMLSFYINLNLIAQIEIKNLGNIIMGDDYTGTNEPLLLMEDNEYLMFQSSNKSGILFTEDDMNDDFLYTSSSVKYGAKIEYDEITDVLKIGTTENYNNIDAFQIWRTSGSIGIGARNMSWTYKLKVFGRAITTHSVWETSDIRLKENIEDINDCSIKLNNIKGIKYEYVKNATLGNVKDDKAAYDLNDTARYKDTFTNHKRYGFSAQEVQKIFPELVLEDEEGYLAINYTGFIPVLVEALKEQEDEIKSLKDNIELLNSSLVSLQNCCSKEKSGSIIEGNNATILYQNTPNPFTEETTIYYELPETIQNAYIYIYEMTGKQIKAFQLRTIGKGSIQINSGELNAGMYMYSLITDGNIIDTKHMILTE